MPCRRRTSPVGRTARLVNLIQYQHQWFMRFQYVTTKTVGWQGQSP
jgi:hypothetical protein